jgi:hypothetical protein
MVNFHTGQELHDAQRCHLNAAVFDFGWEWEAGGLLIRFRRWPLGQR